LNNASMMMRYQQLHFLQVLQAQDYGAQSG
jgi:hypothetical protein